MDKKKDNPREKESFKIVPVESPDPNELLNNFLNNNNLVLSVSAISGDNSYIKGQGFVLTEKPLLVVTANYRV